MKLITAIIQPNKLAAVREALIQAGITRITVSRCAGHGRGTDTELHRGQEFEPPLISKIRLDIACNNEFVRITVDTILKVARSGKIGDGKVFVLPLEECYRIRTGEEGGGAI